MDTTQVVRTPTFDGAQRVFVLLRAGLATWCGGRPAISRVHHVWYTAALRWRNASASKQGAWDWTGNLL